MAETVALSFGGEHRGGLLAKADYQAALLSMSGSGKDLTPDVHGKLGRAHTQSMRILAKYSEPHIAKHLEGALG